MAWCDTPAGNRYAIRLPDTAWDDLYAWWWEFGLLQARTRVDLEREMRRPKETRPQRIIMYRFGVAKIRTLDRAQEILEAIKEADPLHG